MRKSLRTCLLTLPLLLAAMTATAQNGLQKMKVTRNSVASKIQKAAPQRADGSDVTLVKSLACYYDVLSSSLTDYYILLADKGDAYYNSSDGTITATDCNILCLDLYAEPTSPIALPEGTYTAGDGSAVMTYNTEYTLTMYVNSAGQQETAADIDGGVNVVKNDDGTYTVTAKCTNGKTYTYNGKLNFDNTVTTPSVYPQIDGDVNATFTGGLAYYHGNLYESNTGNIYINLYDGDFDASTGGMTSTGHNIAICAFSTLFGNPKAASVQPGVYTMARNFKKDTYYPGMELDYAGMTLLMGTYVKRRTAMTGGDGDYDYAYITDGTITITQNESDGTYNFVIDCVTDRGYKVTGTAENISIPVTDLSDDKPGAIISNLEENVDLDLSYIKTARVYYNGIDNNCRRFLVDIGSASGRDGTEGDLMRFEFLADENEAHLPMGTYNVMEYGHLYTNQFEPFKLVQGYFNDLGGLTGTRYIHFAEGRNCVMDLLAPAAGGRVSIEKVDETNYKFDINIIDDAGFTIKGVWTGPMELNYDASGINGTLADGGKLRVVQTADGNLTIDGVSAADKVSIYSADGRAVLSTSGASLVNASALTPGVYIVKVSGKQPVKFIKK